MTIDWQPLQQIIDQNQSFLLTSHCRADCDALGSELAMAEILEQLGKKVRIVNGDEVPRHISFIDSNGRIETLGDGVTAANLTDLDVLMVLDTSAWVQLGPMAEVVKRFSGTRVVVDHHVSQDDMEATVFKDSATEATGRLVLELCNAINATVTPSIAHQLFTAIATDTGWFRFASVTEKTFQALAQLVAAGANPPQIFAALYERHTLVTSQAEGPHFGEYRDALRWKTDDYPSLSAGFCRNGGRTGRYGRRNKYTTHRRRKPGGRAVCRIETYHQSKPT